MANEDPLILDFGNGSVPDGVDLDEYYVPGLDDELTDWDGIDLEETFELPPVLPPVRLPDETQLAAQARRSTLLADLRALAGEVRTTTVRAAGVNPVFLRLAEEAELVESDGEDLAPGEDAGWLDDLADDSDALDAWEDTFAMVLDTTLEAADDSDPVVAPDLDLEGHGPALVMMLFFSRRDGVPITELGDAIKDAATAGQATEEAGRQWQEWVDAHGDPLRLLLGQLERLGAVSVTDDVARLEPLGMQAVRSKLERDDLFVPVLPAPDKMTPDDLVLVFMYGSDDDLEAELASWTGARGEEQAARELLALAADGNAATRTAAVTIVSRLGQGAGSAWREALARVELRCYAKPQLAQLAGLDPEGTDLPAELQPERADVAWQIADTFGPVSHFDLGKEKFPFDFTEVQRVGGFEKPDEVFEAMARLGHPDAGAVLAMIGKHASDKTTAKAARRAAYKASIRRPALEPRRSPGWSLIAGHSLTLEAARLSVPVLRLGLMTDSRLPVRDRELFLAEPHIAALSVSAGQDRGPLTLPIWYQYAPGGEAWVLTEADSRKARLIEAAGRFTLMVERTMPTVRYVSVEGPVSRMVPGTDEMLREITTRYLPPEKVPAYLEFAKTELGEQVAIYLRPQRWLTADLGPGATPPSSFT